MEHKPTQKQVQYALNKRSAFERGKDWINKGSGYVDAEWISDLEEAKVVV